MYYVGSNPTTRTMKWTKSQIELARRICDNEFNKFFNAEPKEETFREQVERILNQPIVPSYGNEPPWWQQAVAWADQGLIWVRGYGWMQESLWEDIKNVKPRL